jgi:glutaconate CoA-transferase, subunit B
MAPVEVTPEEFMIICGARALQGAASVLVGVGQPNMAALLAQRLYAPGLTLIYESGVIDAAPKKLPLSIGDPTLVQGAASVTSMVDLFAYFLAARRIEVGFVGGAQVDRRGRVNSTVIGDYDVPTARLPGSGGASDIALGVQRLVVMTKHEERRVVEEVDFVTAEVGPGTEELVVTDLAIMSLQDGSLVVDSIHSGVDPEALRDATGWDLGLLDGVATTRAANGSEIDALRSLDPERLYGLNPS